MADRGVGIRPDIRERILERGVTKTVAITALVCILLEHYVTQAAAPIEVADNAPRGTIFTLFIPPTRDAHSATGGSTMNTATVRMCWAEDESELGAPARRACAKTPATAAGRHGGLLAQHARQLLHATPPQLVPPMHHLPDGK